MYKKLVEFYRERLTYSRIIFSKLPLKSKALRLMIALILFILILMDLIVYFIPRLHCSFFDKALKRVRYQDYKVVYTHYGVKTTDASSFIKKYRIEEIKKFFGEKYDRQDFDKFHSEAKYQYGEIQKNWALAKNFVVAISIFVYDRFFTFQILRGNIENNSLSLLIVFLTVVIIYKIATFVTMQIIEKVIYENEIELLDVLESIALEEKFS